MQETGFREQFVGLADAWALAQGIVDTVREPFLVLDSDLRVIAASRSFYSAFKVKPDDTQGRLLYTLGDGQWDIPKLRVLLEKIVPEKGVMEGYEVEHEFPGLGHRTMRLNARQVFYDDGASTSDLAGHGRRYRLANDWSSEKDELLREKDVLMEELQHRTANSLQIIASIILMKSRAVQSAETRYHLEDAHKRVLADRRRAKTIARRRRHRLGRNRALPDEIVRDACGLDDWRQPLYRVESDCRRWHRHFPSGRKPRLDRDRTGHERP